MEKCYEENREPEEKGETKMEKLVRNLIVNSGEDHNVEIVLYGMQVIVDGMISIFALLLLGIILKKVEPTFIFILFSCLFSRSMGGYHASTRGGCAFVTLWMYLIAVYVPERLWTKIPMIVTTGLLMSAIVIIWLFAPVEHPHKPLLPVYLTRNKYISRISSIMISILVIYLFGKHKELSIYLLVNFVEITLSMVAGKILYTECKRL